LVFSPDGLGFYILYLYHIFKKMVLRVIGHKFDRPQQTEHNPITTGSALKVPDIDYSKHKILLAVI